MPHSQPTRASLQVAPLAIAKGHNGSHSNRADAEDDHPRRSDARTNPYSQDQMTPPTTPHGSQEDLKMQPLSRPVFQNFLRAFYPFHPNYAMADSTVTLPLNEGDVVLIHSIHTNGWADGTLLVSGARGWLPTNYCEAYDPEEMRNLLKALLNFWDLLRSTSTNERDIFGNQEFMKGIIAGVRFLLERTNCLTRESATIQRNESLRRGRKSLLSELSSLVKTAKRLQETLRTFSPATEEINNIIDEMILKAFKVVVKGVRFLDMLEDDRRVRAPPAVTVMATVLEESFIPPTPPSESNGFEQGQGGGKDAGSRGMTGVSPTERTPATPAEGVQTNGSTKRLSSAYPRANTLSQGNGNRLSASISHRVSFVGPSPHSQPQNLVSERLNSSHDTFLSYLGSFIGRLHLQSQSRAELALAIKQSATAGGGLLAVVDTVCRNNSLGSDCLDEARAAMYDRIRDLVYSARDILSNAGPDADDVIMPQDNNRLLTASTGCVKAAGECVAKTKWVIERIGDFEFEEADGKLGIDLGVSHQVTENRPATPQRSSLAGSHTSEATSTPSNMQAYIDKPLPQVPGPKPEATDMNLLPASRPDFMGPGDGLSSVRTKLPPLPKLTTSILPEESFYTPLTGDSHDSYRSATLTASSTGTNSTYASRDSESSLLSQTSTRATTPDLTPAPKGQFASEFGNGGGAIEEVDELETRLLEKTYAHELIFNKEGQVTGGSLPALVERLTTQESTPDAVFVSAFYLTFRLFCRPSKLAEVLIDRFDYVGEAPHMASPVRLRVYNVIKGWLESHWREGTDHEALPIIRDFAEHKLRSVLPSAAKRLLELANRVSSTDGSLVPRLVSSMGKTSTSISQYVPADTPLPTPILSKSQLHILSNWKAGGSMPTVLDFEPLEVARQLTLKQMTIFCSILPDELLGSQWMKKGGIKSPNVKAMSGLSTDVSNLVAETILMYPEVKKRAAVIKQWIKVAHQCLELNNYDGLMAIICSLNSSIISRLRKTWDIISPKRREILKTLQAIVEPSSNHKVLRARLQGHVPPCLPFLGMFLTDLTFVDIGNPATKQLPGASSEDHGLTVVNFDKHTRTAKIIGELQRFQIPYRLTEVPDLQEWLHAQIVRVKETDQSNVQVSYYRKSLLLEPRESNAFRGHMDGAAPGTNGQRPDLFSWVSRGRNHSTADAAVI